MGGPRYVLLGLAQARSPWFKQVSQWATSASIAAEFIKCVSGEEIRARLASGRAHSALLIDASLAAFDRDLVSATLATGAAVLVVVDGRAPTWAPRDLGVAAVLPADFGRGELLAALSAHAQVVGGGDELPPVIATDPTPIWRGRLVAVCGPGGTGASTIAMALAQSLAADSRYGRRVLLADLALRAEQAMLHDARDLGPGLQELVEAHRLGRPEPEEVRRATFDVPGRGYRLLLGLRRPAAWSVLRPRAVDVTLDGVRRAFQVVVADITGDLEGETEGGSIEVEERNYLARAATAGADAVFAVGAPGLKGIHSLRWLVRSLTDSGVDPVRVITVVNRAPRHPRARAEMTAALGLLLDIPALTAPIFIPERKIDEAIRDAVALPAALADPLAGAFGALLDRQADAAPPRSSAPVAVTPGSLGTWAGSGSPPAS